jgi:hypothetical protein
VIAGEHDDLDAVCSQAIKRRPRGRLDRVADRDDAARLAVDGNKQRRRTLAAQFVGIAAQVARFDPQVRQQLGVARCRHGL